MSPAPAASGLAAPEGDPELGLCPEHGLEELASGGSARLYALEGSAGRHRLLKLSHPTPAAIAQVRAEAAPLRALGPPLAPRLFRELSLPDGRHGLVLECVEGSSLREWLLTRPAYPELLEAARSLSSAVARVHRAGWAHGDLKPGNVLWDGQQVRLVDFGLARPLVQPRAAAPGTVGTAEYMAPELCLATHGPDARSDVYALGAVLYELFAGRPPFQGSAYQVHRAQVEHRPPPLPAAVPPPIARLIIKSLSKAQVERFEDGAALHEALTAAAEQFGARSSTPEEGARVAEAPPPGFTLPGTSLGPAVPPAPEVEPPAAEGQEGGTVVPSSSGDRFELPLVGRAQLVSSLQQSALEALADRSPAVALVLGEAGMGKSHLLAAVEALLRAALPGMALLTVRGRATPAGSVTRQLLQLLLGAGPGAPLEGAERWLQARLPTPELWPAVAHSLGWLSVEGAPLAALRAAPGALVRAKVRALAALLRSTAARRPLALVVDDAHLTDGVALDAIEYAARDDAGAPLWILLAGAPIFETARPHYAAEVTGRQLHRLGPLDPESAAALCRLLLRPAEDVPGELVERLVATCGAVPLLLTEVIRSLWRSGALSSEGRAGTFTLGSASLERLSGVPLVEWIADQTLAALSPTLAAHARMLAILGEVTLSELQDVLARLDELGWHDRFPLEASAVLRGLVEAQVAVARGGGRFALRTVLLSDGIAAATPAQERQAVHRAAYEVLRAAPELDEARVAQLARHASHLGLAAEALAAYSELGEKALARQAYLDAEEHFTRALGQAGAGGASTAIVAYRGRGLARTRLGRREAALEDLARARIFASERGERRVAAGILLDEATVLDWCDDYHASREAAIEAARLAPRGDPLLAARLTLARGRALHRFGDAAGAAEALEQARQQSADLGEHGYETWVVALILRSFVLQGLGEYEQAAEALHQAVAGCERHRDGLHLLAALNNRALLHGYRGDITAMSRDFAAIVQLSRELGQPVGELVAEYNQAELLMWADSTAAARPHLERAKVIDARRSGAEGRPVIALLGARLELWSGDWAQTRRALEAVEAHQRDARARQKSDWLLLPSEELLCTALGAMLRGVPSAEWDALVLRSDQVSVGQERVEVLAMRAMGEARAGRLAEARVAVAAAEALSARTPGLIRILLKRVARESATARFSRA